MKCPHLFLISQKNRSGALKDSQDYHAGAALVMEVPDDTNITGWAIPHIGNQMLNFCYTDCKTWMGSSIALAVHMKSPTEPASHCACSCSAGSTAHSTGNNQGYLQDAQHEEVSETWHSTCCPHPSHKRLQTGLDIPVVPLPPPLSGPYRLCLAAPARDPVYGKSSTCT